MRPRLLCWQTYLIAALAAADLISTIWLCRVYGAAEANPIMSAFLAQGLIAFAAAKIALTVAPLGLLEWVRRSRPRLGVIALNTVLLGYLTLYSAGLAHLNSHISFEQMARELNSDPAYAAPLERNRQLVEAKRRGMVADREVAGRAPTQTISGNEPSACKSLPDAADVNTVNVARPCDAMN